MLLFVKNSLLFLYYGMLCFLMLTNHLRFVKTTFFYFFPVMMLYYLVMIQSRVHMMYLYFVMEKRYVRWKQLWQFFFHMAIFLGTDALFIAVAGLVYMFLYKELFFTIKFAEKRLAKIEESIDEKMPQFRVAHLHLNVFEEDMENRFHESCFNSNRLYLLETTSSSRETQLGIINYREIRKNKKKPREMTEREKVLYNASSNETMFLSDRNYFIFYPLGILFFLLLCTLVGSYSILQSYLYVSLICGDVVTYMTMDPQYHDVYVDAHYAVASLVFAQLNYR